MSAARTGGRWSMLTAASLVLAFSAIGFLIPTFGVFSAAIEAAYGWSRTETYSVLAIATLLTPVMIPLAGWAADRFDLRKLVLGSLAAEIACLCVLGLVPLSQAGFATVFLLTFAASAGANAIPMAKAIGGAFSTRRGFALGILFAGANIGSIVNPLIVGALIGGVGWQGAFLALAVQVAVVAGIPAFFLLRPGAPAPAADADAPAAQAAGMRTLVRSRTLYVILGWAFFAALGYGGIQGHLVPMLEERMHSPAEAVVGQSMLGVGLFVGNLGAGLLLDRISTPRLASLMLSVPIIALVALATLPATPADFVIVGVIGIAIGTESSLLAYVVAEYLPPSVNGRALAIGMIAIAVGGGVSMMLGGLTHDATGDYRLFLWICAAALAIGSLWPFGLRGSTRHSVTAAATEASPGT